MRSLRERRSSTTPCSGSTRAVATEPGVPGHRTRASRRARSHGIVWVNAAGNAARTHWGGTFSDTNGNARHEFAPGDEGNGMTVPPGTQLCVRLKWDEWPTSSSDYDLFLERTSGRRRPRVVDERPADDAVPADGNVVLDEHRRDRRVCRRRDHAGLCHGLSTPRPLHRRAIAGSGRRPEHRRAGLFAGGDRGRRRVLERYRDPALQLRRPDNRRTHEAGPGRPGRGLDTDLWPFDLVHDRLHRHVVAAAPYVAGLLALRRSAQPGISAAALEASLATDATDLGVAGKDTTTGAGLAWLPTPAASPGQVAYAVAGASPADRDLVVSSPDGEHPVRITGAGGDDTDPAIDPSGGRVAFTRTIPARRRHLRRQHGRIRSDAAHDEPRPGHPTGLVARRRTNRLRERAGRRLRPLGR